MFEVAVLALEALEAAYWTVYDLYERFVADESEAEDDERHADDG